MDNPCNMCVANDVCPYYGHVDFYDAQCDEVIARAVEKERDSYRIAWDSYVRVDDIDFHNALSSLF